MVAANTYGRQIVVPLTNKSGGGVIAGDVVVINSANSDAFTTTTSANSTAIVGVAQETIANNATGRVCLGGYVPLVNVNASCTVLHYGATYTVAKQATDVGTSRASGTCMVFLTTSTTPDAFLFNPDLGGASLTNPMTTGGDMIYGGASGTPTRLANGSAATMLTSAGGTSAPTWTGFAAASATLTGGDYTLTSATFVDLDTTNLKLTITTLARRVLIVVVCTANVTGGAGKTINLDVSVGGTRLGGAYGLSGVQSPATNYWQNLSFSFLTTALTAASHEFRLMARSDGTQTVTINANTNNPLHFAVIEQGG